MKFDRRVTPFSGRVAAERLRGRIEAQAFSAGAARQVLAPVAELSLAPQGDRARQLLRGAAVTVYEERDGWAFVEAAQDGYCGWVPAQSLGAVDQATHWVASPATHAYEDADFKSRDLMRLSLGARLRVIGKAGPRFVETCAGYVPHTHLKALGTWEVDPVTVAETLVGTPYLWGGNSRDGIDCSGLVQAACLACGIECPGDSDMQQRRLGRDLAPGTAPMRGDVMFWKGHVAWVAGEDMLLHANAHHMAVAYEPLAEAVARIEAQGDGPVTAHKRLG